ncbi:MAG: hypothetical protein DWQ34_18640 [Planctomycetota bacterium]|nr:MAG: hypothetical protein DWQ34_18640 [Planctomycetota bacterium]REK26415.1 MAG: hypothetical protein DWQ41_09955 [Planctomycetota bacterium]REK32048.1 MAG: hypothetical protein DWQ45_17945 [Planctomycetota bacterium]
MSGIFLKGTGWRPASSTQLLFDFNDSPVNSPLERLEWNADGHGLDRFSLIFLCKLQAVHA